MKISKAQRARLTDEQAELVALAVPEPGAGSGVIESLVRAIRAWRAKRRGDRPDDRA